MVNTSARAVENAKLDKLITRTNQNILTIHSVFPFDLFPDTIHIDENKVEIIHRPFFFEEQIFPILISRITSAKITTNPFFATLKLEIRGYETNPEAVRMLWYKDAIKAKRIITGLIACSQENIDLSAVNINEAAQKIEKIGKALEHQDV